MVEEYDFNGGGDGEISKARGRRPISENRSVIPAKSNAYAFS